MEHAELLDDLIGFLYLLTCMAFVLAIIFISKMGGRRKHRREAGLDSEGQAVAESLVRIAEKMEKRLEALEKILETEDPKWKERA